MLEKNYKIFIIIYIFIFFNSCGKEKKQISYTKKENFIENFSLILKDKDLLFNLKAKKSTSDEKNQIFKLENIQFTSNKKDIKQYELKAKNGKYDLNKEIITLNTVNMLKNINTTFNIEEITFNNKRKYINGKNSKIKFFNHNIEINSFNSVNTFEKIRGKKVKAIINY